MYQLQCAAKQPHSKEFLKEKCQKMKYQYILTVLTIIPASCKVTVLDRNVEKDIPT